jgi:peptidylprolyl isomerase
VVVLLAVSLSVVALFASPAVAADGPLAEVTVSKNVKKKPTLEFDQPFSVKETAHEVVVPGTGEALAAGQDVSFHYLLVDARTGKQLQTSWGKAPASLVVDATKTAPPLVDGLTGVAVGSRVLIAIAPKDGLAAQLSSQGVKKNDTLFFVVDVKSVIPQRASGETVPPVEGLPGVTLAADGKPTITVPPGVAAPTKLVVQPLIKGTGPVVKKGQTITVHYTGVIWDTGTQFDSSWDRGQPTDFVIGKSKVIAGWDEGLVGQTVGSQVLLVVPPDKGYGASGQSQAGIKGTDTLVFVVDVLAAS